MYYSFLNSYNTAPSISTIVGRSDQWERNITTGLFGLQFPALNGVAIGNQILENVLLAFKMSGNCHFQIK